MTVEVKGLDDASFVQRSGKAYHCHPWKVLPSIISQIGLIQGVSQTYAIVRS